jgi:hypothetical protein
MRHHHHAPTRRQRRCTLAETTARSPPLRLAAAATPLSRSAAVPDAGRGAKVPTLREFGPRYIANHAEAKDVTPTSHAPTLR